MDTMAKRKKVCSTLQNQPKTLNYADNWLPCYGNGFEKLPTMICCNAVSTIKLDFLCQRHRGENEPRQWNEKEEQAHRHVMLVVLGKVKKNKS